MVIGILYDDEQHSFMHDLLCRVFLLGAILDMYSLQWVPGKSNPTVRQMELCEHGGASQAKVGHTIRRRHLSQNYSRTLYRLLSAIDPLRQEIAEKDIPWRRKVEGSESEAVLEI